MECISDVLTELYSLRTALLLLVNLLQIALTMVVRTAHCERSFSALKRIKTYLCSSMTEQRLTDLAMLSIVSKQISLDNVIDEFAAKEKTEELFCLSYCTYSSKVISEGLNFKFFLGEHAPRPA